MYINEWYMPSVLLAWLFGHRGYASGQTLCLRRAILWRRSAACGVWLNHLADDYRLGELIRGAGAAHRAVAYWVQAEHVSPIWTL